MQPQIQKTVFISYRRTNIALAQVVRFYLVNHGFDVFFDYSSLDSGAFQAGAAETFRTTYRPKESDRWRSLGAAGKDGVVRLPGRSVATIALTR